MIDMRRSIDRLDTAFLNLLSERMRTVDRIVARKKRQNLDLAPGSARREEMRELIEMSVQLRLEPRFFGTILDLVFQDAVKRQNGEPTPANHADALSAAEEQTLAEIRSSLFSLDKALCLVLAERFRVVKRIGLHKQKLNLPPLDASRWRQVMADKAEQARRLELSVDLVRDIFDAIHQVALSLEADPGSPLKR